MNLPGVAETPLVVAARGGDREAFAALTEPLARELRVYCYRMLGSLPDAEDALQESLLRAWRHLDRFEGRSALRAWLFAIATNVCLTAGRRRANEESLHLTPIPDDLLDEPASSETGPAAAYDLKESVQLAFLAAIQLLSPRQRSILLLREVLGWSAREVADLLGVSVASVNSALQRARAALQKEQSAGRLRVGGPASPDPVERSLVRRFVEAWEAVDIDGLVALLADDARLTMPPFPMRYIGRAAIGRFLSSVPAGGALDRIRLLPTRANRQPALAAYELVPHDGNHRAYGIMVLAMADREIAEIIGFSDPSLFPLFGLPLQLDRH